MLFKIAVSYQYGLLPISLHPLVKHSHHFKPDLLLLPAKSNLHKKIIEVIQHKLLVAFVALFH